MDGPAEEIISKFEERQSKERFWWFHRLCSYVADTALPFAVFFVFGQVAIKRLGNGPLIWFLLIMVAAFFARERRHVWRLERLLDEAMQNGGLRNGTRENGDRRL
jgi:hypothetical protein